ncbi:MAG: helix-turn-helix domain-containing protein [Oligoflexia bacterium]|nr:helix-turn-helix domain-containing protein [Oligoflexia bacterium]
MTKTKTNRRITVQDTARVLRGVRKQLKLTQVVVSKKMGISQGSLSKMETAKAEPSAIQWMEFCRTTGIPTDVLFRDDFNIGALKPLMDKGKKVASKRI